MNSTQQDSSHRAPADKPEILDLCGQLEAAMITLSEIAEEESALVAKGALDAALALQDDKNTRLARFVQLMERVQQGAAELRRSAPEVVDGLKRAHGAFDLAMQENMAVLATAQAVTLGLMQCVSEAVQRHERPRRYSAGGQLAAEAHREDGLSLNRNL